MDYRIDQLRYQLREDPSSRVFYQLAEALRRQGEAEEAAGLLRRGLEIHPKYTAAWVALGRTLRDLDDVDGAGDAFGRALELDRSNLVAARAVGELAADRGDWAAAAAAFGVVCDVVPDDSEMRARISEAESRIAEEAAEREALAAAPPAEVVRLVDGDPFADEAVDEVEDGASDDVFGETEAVAEITDESISPDAAEDLTPDDPFLVEDSLDPEPTREDDEPLFEALVATQNDETPDAESWADVTDDEAADTFDAVQVVPPSEAEQEDLESEAAPDVEPAEAEAKSEIPEFAEPIIEELPEPPAEPEPESWTDLEEELSSATDEELEEAAGEEPIIPATLAAFDHPTGDLEEEPEHPSVLPQDVPLPTLTLARLALQQGDDGLAEATLQSLVERDPANSEAVELLENLRSGPPEDDRGTTSAKVAALRGWLDTIRLASERQST